MNSIFAHLKVIGRNREEESIAVTKHTQNDDFIATHLNGKWVGLRKVFSISEFRLCTADNIHDWSALDGFSAQYASDLI